MTTAITDELDWRSHSLMAEAIKATSRERHRSATITNVELFLASRSIATDLRKFIIALHSQKTINAYETSPIEEVIETGERMKALHNKITKVVAKLRSEDLGLWRRLIEPSLNQLEVHNRELGLRMEAFISESRPILLSKKDQARLIDSLSNPPEPNAALRRAFSRK